MFITLVVEGDLKLGERMNLDGIVSRYFHNGCLAEILKLCTSCDVSDLLPLVKVDVFRADER